MRPERIGVSRQRRMTPTSGRGGYQGRYPQPETFAFKQWKVGGFALHQQKRATQIGQPFN
ncbi:hypothetical protein J2T60_000191 [Natronospira proteinivora]|uniref:Uncharacterized protein n=1 Tax=Natronospira proteinivora TaxID=1807133 RepID=A0ABT1G4M0_9GAMM|nr:hypothetical protein [Natronospira proteinivora]